MIEYVLGIGGALFGIIVGFVFGQQLILKKCCDTCVLKIVKGKEK